MLNRETLCIGSALKLYRTLGNPGAHMLFQYTSEMRTSAKVLSFSVSNYEHQPSVALQPHSTRTQQEEIQLSFLASHSEQ